MSIIKTLKSSISEKGNYCYSLPVETTKEIIKDVKQLQQENQELKDNWNKLKKYLINDINNRNGNRVVEYEDGRKASETISPIYTLMEDKSKTMKKVLNKMQEIEQGSDE